MVTTNKNVFEHLSRILHGAFKRLPQDSVAVITDMDNLSLSLPDDMRPDYTALLKYAATKGKLVCAEAFAQARPSQGFQRLIALMSRIGYSVNILQPNQMYSGHRKQCPVDQAISARAIGICIRYKLSHIVFCSGDGDFVPVVQELRILGIHVTVVGPIRGCTARSLVEAADEVVYLTSIGMLRKTNSGEVQVKYGPMLAEPALAAG